jgi:hypothetical protein
MDDYGFLMHAFAVIAVGWAIIAGWSVWDNFNHYLVRAGLAHVIIQWHTFVPYVYLVVYVFWLFS